MGNIGTIDLSGLYHSSFFKKVNIFYEERDSFILMLNGEILINVLIKDFIGELIIPQKRLLENNTIEDIKKLIIDYIDMTRPRPDSGFVHS